MTRQQIEQLFPEFLGPILQTPPQISALKGGGQRAYKLARRGVVVELKPRPVDVFSLALMEQIDLTILPLPGPPRRGEGGKPGRSGSDRGPVPMPSLGDFCCAAPERLPPRHHFAPTLVKSPGETARKVAREPIPSPD